MARRRSTLERLVETIASRFPDDEVRPGVVLSFLGPGKVYGSVVRLRNRPGEPGQHVRTAIAKTTDTTIEKTVRTLSVQLDGVPEGEAIR